MGPKKVAAKSGGGSSKAKDAGKQAKTAAEPVAGGEKVPKSVADARKALGGVITAEQVVEILPQTPIRQPPTNPGGANTNRHKPIQIDFEPVSEPCDPDPKLGSCEI